MTPFIYTKMSLEIIVNNYGAEYIKSRSNPTIVKFSKLADRKYRDEYGLYLAEGVKLCREAMDYAGVECVVVSASGSESENVMECIESAHRKEIRIIISDDAAYEKISTEKSPQGVTAVVKYPAELNNHTSLADWAEGKRILMLDEIRDPGNLGTIIRSSEAMGIDGVILSSCADLYSPKTMRAAMGALFRMPTYLTNDTASAVRELKQHGRRVIASALYEKGESLTLGEYECRSSDCVIIGNEGHGISPEVIEECGCTVKIPMVGRTESLNAASAAVCILWEYFREEHNK